MLLINVFFVFILMAVDNKIIKFNNILRISYFLHFSSKTLPLIYYSPNKDNAVLRTILVTPAFTSEPIKVNLSIAVSPPFKGNNLLLQGEFIAYDHNSTRGSGRQNRIRHNEFLLHINREDPSLEIGSTYHRVRRWMDAEYQVRSRMVSGNRLP